MGSDKQHLSFCPRLLGPQACIKVLRGKTIQWSIHPSCRIFRIVTLFWFVCLCVNKVQAHTLTKGTLAYGGMFGNLCSDGWAIEEANSVVPAVTPTSIWVWPDPAVLLNLTCYMTGALAHLASLRQPLAAIWVSLSAQSSPGPRIAEVVDFPLLPHSISTPSLLPSRHPQISIFFFFAVTHSHFHGPEAFSTPGDCSLEQESP